MRIAKAQLEIGIETGNRPIPTAQLETGKLGVVGLEWTGDVLVITHEAGKVQAVPGPRVIVMDIDPSELDRSADAYLADGDKLEAPRGQLADAGKDKGKGRK